MTNLQNLFRMQVIKFHRQDFQIYKTCEMIVSIDYTFQFKLRHVSAPIQISNIQKKKRETFFRTKYDEYSIANVVMWVQFWPD
jgi:hypothetical protein